jgi:hypothetical protein
LIVAGRKSDYTEGMRHAPRRQTNTLQLVLVVVGFGLLFYYAVTAMMARDPRWFTGEFSGRPSRIIVYHDGERAELVPGADDFDQLGRAVESSLDQGFSGLSSLGLSEASLQDAYTQDVTLEVFYQEPVELHVWFDPGKTTQMLFLITGRYGDMSIVLLGDDGRYRSGAPVLEDMAPIREALWSLGYL